MFFDESEVEKTDDHYDLSELNIGDLFKARYPFMIYSFSNANAIQPKLLNTGDKIMIVAAHRQEGWPGYCFEALFKENIYIVSGKYLCKSMLELL
jgi:hypothetical protein